MRSRKEEKLERLELDFSGFPHVLSVDPGIQFGWALWNSETWHVCEPPVMTGIQKTSGYQKAPWSIRLDAIIEGFRDLVETSGGIGALIIEWPAFFDTAGGRTVASRGDLGKLHTVVGAIIGAFQQLDTGLQVAYAPVHDWKGQLPKEVVKTRIRKILPKGTTFEFKSHIWDAVGIGLYGKGFFGAREKTFHIL